MNNLEQSKKKIVRDKDRVSFKDVTQALKEEKLGFSPQLFWFALLTILSFCLAYVFSYSLILTVPLVIIPSWFAFTSVNSLKGVKNAENVTFFLMYKNYFGQLFFGGYRLLFGLLKGFIAYFIGSFIGFAIFDAAILSKNSEYQALIEKLTSPNNLTEISDEMLNFISSPQYEKPMFIIGAISLVLGAFVFIHHILKHSPKMRRNLFNRSPIPMRQFHSVDANVRKKNRKYIFSSYFATTWFIQLLVILLSVGSIVLCYFFLAELDAEKAVIITLFIIFVATLPFANYVSVVQTFIYLDLSRKYEQTFVNMTLEFLNRFKDKIGIEESDAAKIKEFLDLHQKENGEQNKEDNNEEK